ncbi:MAG: hypothetical protein AAFR61_29985 [Bacteroidota bacterium]
MKKLLQALLAMHPQTRMTLLDQMLVSGSNFLVGILLTRWTGLEGYGYFALAWLGMLFVIGMQQGLVLQPFMSLWPQTAPEERTLYLRKLHGLQWSLSLVVLGLSALLVSQADAWLQGWQVSSLFPVLAIAMFLFLMQDFFRRLLLIQQRAAQAFILDIVAYGGWLSSLLFLHLNEALNIYQVYVWMYICFGLSALWGMIQAYQSFLPSFFLTSIWKKHWSIASWLMGTALLQFFSSNYFLLAAAALLGSAGLGALRMAQNLVGLTHILFQAMENTIPVKVAQAYAEDGWAGMLRYLKVVSFRTGLAISGILALVALGAPWILGWVYGEQYAAYHWLLVAYCGFYLLMFPSYPLRYLLRTLQHTQPIFVAYVLSTLFSLSLAYPITEKWGLAGVVAGLTINQLIMEMYYAWCIRKRKGLGQLEAL